MTSIFFYFFIFVAKVVNHEKLIKTNDFQCFLLSDTSLFASNCDADSMCFLASVFVSFVFTFYIQKVDLGTPFGSRWEPTGDHNQPNRVKIVKKIDAGLPWSRFNTNLLPTFTSNGRLRSSEVPPGGFLMDL